jgi:hypothetical protein
VQLARIDPERSRAKVTARAPGHSFVAEGLGIEGEIGLDGDRLVSIAARFPLASLKASDPIGQMQLARFLDLPSRPIAEASLLSPIDLSSSNGRLTGRGRIRLSIGPRRTEADLAVEGTRSLARGRLEITFTGLGYEPPRLLFLKVRDDLTVEVELSLAG